MHDTKCEKPPEFLEQSTTERGFSVIKFNDYYDVSCSLQESSLGETRAVWFGVNNAEPQILASQARAFGIFPPPGTTGWVPYPIPKEVLLKTRMHLSQEQVQALLPSLQHFAQTGYLPEDLSTLPPTQEGVNMSEALPIQYSVDNGVTYQEAPQGVRVIHGGVDVEIDGAEAKGAVHFNHTTEGLVVDVWGHKADGNDIPLGSQSFDTDDIVDLVVVVDTAEIDLEVTVEPE